MQLMPSVCKITSNPYHMGISTSTSQVDRTQLVRGGGESCLGLRIEILGHQGTGHPEGWLKLDVQWEWIGFLGKIYRKPRGFCHQI